MARVSKTNKKTKTTDGLKAKKAASQKGGVQKVKRRYKRHTKGYKDYCKWVKHTGTIIPAAPVKNMARQISRGVMPDVRMTGKAIIGLHHALESFLHDYSRRAKDITANSRNVQTTEGDIALAWKIMTNA